MVLRIDETDAIERLYAERVVMDNIDAGQPDREADLSDLELLSFALEDAMDAYRKGVLIGPAPDLVVWGRAQRRARRADAARALRTIPDDAA